MRSQRLSDALGRLHKNLISLDPRSVDNTYVAVFVNVRTPQSGIVQSDHSDIIAPDPCRVGDIHGAVQIRVTAQSILIVNRCGHKEGLDRIIIEPERVASQRRNAQ